MRWSVRGADVQVVGIGTFGLVRGGGSGVGELGPEMVGEVWVGWGGKEWITERECGLCKWWGGGWGELSRG